MHANPSMAGRNASRGLVVKGQDSGPREAAGKIRDHCCSCPWDWGPLGPDPPHISRDQDRTHGHVFSTSLTPCKSNTKKEAKLSIRTSLSPLVRGLAQATQGEHSKEQDQASLEMLTGQPPGLIVCPHGVNQEARHCFVWNQVKNIKQQYSGPSESEFHLENGFSMPRLGRGTLPAWGLAFSFQSPPHTTLPFTDQEAILRKVWFCPRSHSHGAVGQMSLHPDYDSGAIQGLGQL
jgi:hypothetical protein